MTLKRHKYPPYMKALLHFDYGYPDSIAAAAGTTEAAGGLRDEIGLDTWTRTGYTTFVGQESPAIVVAGTPKFGWRCPQFGGTGDYIKTANTSGNWNLKPAGKYEMSFFVRPTGAVAGNILVLRSASADLLTLTKNASNQLVLKSEPWDNIYKTSTANLTLHMFNYITVRIANKTVTVYADGREMLSASFTSTTPLQVAEVRLGGFLGQIDEFTFLHTATGGVPVAPTVPFAGAFDVNTIGGFGNGTFGDETLSTAGNVQVNTYAPVTALSVSAATIGSVNNGRYGTFVPGNEVMVHLSLKKGADESQLGFYALRRISRIVGADIVFDRPIVDEFDASTAVQKYNVQLLSVPNFKSLVIQLGTVVVPKLWDGSSGGIVAFKAQGNCTINGMIISEGTGPKRTDSLALTHTDIAEHFINTGSVFIVCGGILKAPDEARIGASHPGDLKGVVGFGANGTNAGKANGGVGGNPGFSGKGGKAGPVVKVLIWNGPSSTDVAGGGGGGGGSRGNGGNGGEQLTPKKASDGSDGCSAPNIILVVHKLVISTKVISTGGSGGGGGGSGCTATPNGQGSSAGGGTGGSSLGVGGAVPGAAGYDGTEKGSIGNITGGGRGGNVFHATTNGSYNGGGGAGGAACGAGYGGNGGEGGPVTGSPSGGGGGGGGGTGHAYISCEEMGYDG